MWCQQIVRKIKTKINDKQNLPLLPAKELALQSKTTNNDTQNEEICFMFVGFFYSSDLFDRPLWSDMM